MKLSLTLKYASYHIDKDWVQSLYEWGGTIVVVGGVSGVGKTTITEELHLAMPKSVTSREPKKAKESYDFVSKDAFLAAEKNAEYATIVHYKEGSFGLPKSRWDEVAKKNRVVLLVMNPIGYRLLKGVYPKTFGIFITAPFETVMERLEKRDGFLDEVRVASYENNHRSVDYYHYVYENTSSIRKAVWTIKRMICKFRLIAWWEGERGIDKYFPSLKVLPTSYKPNHKKKRANAVKHIAAS